MPGVFFWNLYGRQEKNRAAREAAICASLTRLARTRELDVLVFCECEMPEEAITRALNAADVGRYHLPPSRSRRIKVWTRLPQGAVSDRHNGRLTDRITIREVLFPNALPVLLAGVHLVDRLTVPTEEGRASHATEFAAVIHSKEKELGHSRTVLVGDLNMNPYEAGVVGTRGFHAVMTRQLARTVPRLAARSRHPGFYNPMWSCFGDVSPGPPGTHYWSNAEEPTNHFWQLYDQVLVRPELVDAFVRVQVISTDGEIEFMTPTGRPRARVLSDHLPICAEFRFTTEE